MGVTYDFFCSHCRKFFEVMGCQPGDLWHPCPDCDQAADRSYEPGAWTTPGVGVFKPHYDWSLGRFVESKSQARRFASKMGLVEKGSTPVREKRVAPTPQEFHRGIRDLTRDQVLRHREKRERAEWEDRNGPIRS